MSAASLRGVGVLVTRPEGLAEPLCRSIVAAGGVAIRWPTVTITSNEPDSDALARLRAAGSDAWAIFVSRNAVSHGAALVASAPRPAIAAIGPSTADALTAQGLSLDLVPAGYDSETLLADARLAELRGRSVFIIRGVGGRELLGSVLRERGADVAYLEVYRRERTAHTRADTDSLLHRWRAGGIHVYTATSVAIYENLRADLGADGAALMAATALVTASRRVVKRAREAGHHAALLLASGPDDRSLLETITDWGAAVSAHPTDQNNE